MDRIKLIVAISGASAVQYGIEFLESLQHKNVEIHLVMSEWAEKLILTETDYQVADVRKMAHSFYDNNQLDAPISSSSFLVDGMVILPCSIKTSSEIANAHTGTLIARSADNILKMRKKLILGVRETPLSTPALEQLYKLSLAGATIMPLTPGFYHKPKEIKDLIDFMNGKIMDCLGIENDEFLRWK